MSYDHLEIRPLTVVERKKTPVPVKPPQRHYASHARQLTAAVGEIAQTVRAKRETGGAQVPSVAYFSVKMSRSLPEKDLLSVHIHPIMQQGKNCVLAFGDENELSNFVAQLDQYALGPTDGHKEAYKAGVLSNIEEVLPRNPKDRLPASLQNMVIRRSATYELDFEVLPQPYNVRLSDRLGALQALIQDSQGAVEDLSDEGTYALIRALVTGQCLHEILDYWDDVNIRDLPEFSPSVREILQFDQDAVPDVPEPGADRPLAVIIDTGIAEGHPLLAPAVKAGRSRSFHSGTTDPTDFDGHGTEVAGRGLYGRIEDCVSSKVFRPEFWIAGAKVLHGGRADKELFTNKMVRIADHFGEDARLYNMSIGDLNSVYDGTAVSPWAEALDKLSVSRDVIFVISAGNIPGLGILESFLSAYGGYPNHWKAPESRLYSPAEAAHALTVGAVAGSDELYNPASNRTVLAGKLDPAPFSRRGPGLGDSIKPDLVEIGGNVYLDTITGFAGADDPQMRVISLDSDFVNTGKLLVFGGPGTSVAAPTVMNVAGNVLAKFPRRSGNLIRALVVNSARLPAINVPKEMVPQLYGYGIPILERALFSTNKRVTLIHEGVIKADTCQVFAIPLPENLVASNFKKEITITLAHNSPVNRIKANYFGIELDWKLAKGPIRLEQVLAKVAEEMESDSADEDANIWWAGEYPGFRRRSKGSVQKDVFRWSRADRGTQLFLAVTAKRRWIVDPDYVQPFAVVVTIEDFSEAVTDIFSPIRTAIKERLTARP